jgi:hypothetical protein
MAHGALPGLSPCRIHLHDSVESLRVPGDDLTVRADPHFHSCGGEAPALLQDESLHFGRQPIRIRTHLERCHVHVDLQGVGQSHSNRQSGHEGLPSLHPPERRSVPKKLDVALHRPKPREAPAPHAVQDAAGPDLQIRTGVHPKQVLRLPDNADGQTRIRASGWKLRDFRQWASRSGRPSIVQGHPQLLEPRFQGAGPLTEVSQIPLAHPDSFDLLSQPLHGSLKPVVVGLLLP